MYLDPGFGGMILQAIVAVVAMGGAIIYSLRRKIRNLFSRKSEDSGKKDVSAVSSASKASSRQADSDDDAVDMLDDSQGE